MGRRAHAARPATPQLHALDLSSSVHRRHYLFYLYLSIHYHLNCLFDSADISEKCSSKGILRSTDVPNLVVSLKKYNQFLRNCFVYFIKVASATSEMYPVQGEPTIGMKSKTNLKN